MLKLFSLLTRLCVLCLPLFLLPLIAHADGGPIPTDSELWAQLQEGQQIAVVRINQDNSALVDLFVTIQDKSGQPHQITYFVPLGPNPTDFQVIQETAGQFDSLTFNYDSTLRSGSTASRKSDYQNTVRASLLIGSALINGAWSWPLWLLAPLVGCGSLPQPIASYEAPGSQVSIYGLDQTTDLQALISTTGLDPAVKNTLARLQGQQIAVIRLQTQALIKPGTNPSGGSTSQVPGLHLSWKTGLAPGESYTYPLGTGSAWAAPIEITRVYVIAAPQADFMVKYPELGSDLNGYERVSYYTSPRILNNRTEKGFAVDNAVGTYGRYWRVTYTQSNSAEDLIITRIPRLSPETQHELDLMGYRERIVYISWFLSIIAALGAWLVAWRYGMPWQLGIQYRWRDLRFWVDAFRWSVFPIIAILGLMGVVAVVYLFVPTPIPRALNWMSPMLYLAIGALFIPLGIALLLALPGVLGLMLFSSSHAGRAGITRRNAARAYIVVVVMANAIYLVIAGTFAFVVGAL